MSWSHCHVHPGLIQQWRAVIYKNQRSVCDKIYTGQKKHKTAVRGHDRNSCLTPKFLTNRILGSANSRGHTEPSKPNVQKSIAGIHSCNSMAAIGQVSKGTPIFVELHNKCQNHPSIYTRRIFDLLPTWYSKLLFPCTPLLPSCLLYFRGIYNNDIK